MSYDIDLVIDTGGPEPAIVCGVGNCTCNVSPMWKMALGFSLADMDGKNAGESIDLLYKAVRHMRDPANVKMYRAMNPDNGWGNHEGATEYLEGLLRACERHPKATISVSY